MKQKLTEYVDAIFRCAALTVRNAELKEEIMQNTLEKYDDLIADGDGAYASLWNAQAQYYDKKQ